MLTRRAASLCLALAALAGGVLLAGSDTSEAGDVWAYSCADAPAADPPLDCVVVHGHTFKKGVHHNLWDVRRLKLVQGDLVWVHVGTETSICEYTVIDNCSHTGETTSNLRRTFNSHWNNPTPQTVHDITWGKGPRLTTTTTITTTTTVAPPSTTIATTTTTTTTTTVAPPPPAQCAMFHHKHSGLGCHHHTVDHGTPSVATTTTTTTPPTTTTTTVAVSGCGLTSDDRAGAVDGVPTDRNSPQSKWRSTWSVCVTAATPAFTVGIQCTVAGYPTEAVCHPGPSWYRASLLANTLLDSWGCDVTAGRHRHTSTADHSGHGGACHEHPQPTACDQFVTLIDPDDDGGHVWPSLLCPRVNAVGGATVFERVPGACALFRFEPHGGAEWLPVTVSYTVSQAGDYVAADDLGDKTVTLPAGALPVDVCVPVVNDTTAEPHGAVTVTVNHGAGYYRGDGDTVPVYDDDSPPPPNTYLPQF